MLIGRGDEEEQTRKEERKMENRTEERLDSLT
jgi:hypothetical protein